VTLLLGHVGGISDIRFAVDRDIAEADWHLVSRDEETLTTKKMGSEETVIHKLDGSKEIVFKSFTGADTTFDMGSLIAVFPPGCVGLELVMDLLVEH